ncbi:hypothetical protein Tco_1282141 [Tanacetum coccineum]
MALSPSLKYFHTALLSFLKPTGPNFQSEWSSRPSILWREQYHTWDCPDLRLLSFVNHQDFTSQLHLGNL